MKNRRQDFRPSGGFSIATFHLPHTYHKVGEVGTLYYLYMLFVTFAHHYLLWHYTQGLRELLHLYRNFMWFINRLFSLPELARSLFSPFKRIVEPKSERWSFEDFASRLVIGLLSRIIGFFIRLTLIVTGLVFMAMLTTVLLVLLAAWFFAPAVVVLGVLYAVILMTRF
jgi:hypothetical protein